jgi:hypothetical protein
MSGGHWEYKQYFLTEVIEDIRNLIDKNGKEKTREELNELKYDPDWYKKYPEDKFHPEYSNEIIEEFKKAYTIVKKAQIYIQRLDWLLSGDDGDDNFLRRLKEDLNEKDNNKIHK